MDFYTWLQENIDPKVISAKHRTEAGGYLGRIYRVHLPCDKRGNGIDIIRFTDGLVLVLNGAWVTEEAAKAILLAAKAAQ